jgi:hypothetical protein
LFGEGGCDNANRKCHQHQASENRHGRNHLADPGYGHDVPVTNRPDRDDRPPEGIGNSSELVRLNFSFCQVHQGSGNQRGAESDDKTADQRAPFVV